MSLSMREQEEAQLLLVVEDLLSRFYQSHTSSEEKKKLEAELHDLRTSRFNWRYCLDNLDKFHNQYLWFFGSSTVEAVLSRWPSLSASEKEYLRSGLIKLLSNYTAATPALHREKVAQILALVASFQFPTDYPEYIEHILQLLKERFPIGLALARALGDSVTQKKYVMSLQWQERFKAAVTPHISDILRALEPYFAYYLASVVEPSNASDMPTSMEQYTNELLQMLQQYFGWIELQGVEPTLAEVLLQMSRLRPNTDQTVVPVSALSALTELYYRQQLLTPATGKHMVLGVKELLQQPGLPSAEELYQDKLGDLVRLCAMRELTAKHMLDWEPFFESLYQFTVSMRILQLYYEHLDTWIMIYQVAVDKQVSRTDPAVHRLLSEVFPLKLSTLTMERMLHPNDGWHEHLAMCDLDISDEEVSELQKYYNLGLELVENIAYFAPQRMYEAVLSPLATSDASPYRRGLHMLHAIAIRPDIVVPDSSKCFTDFIPACQMVARLGTLLHEKVPAIASVGRWLVQEQLELFTLLADCMLPLDRFYRWQGEPQKMIVATAQTMNTFRSLLPQIEPIKGTSACQEPPAFTEQQLKRLITQLTKVLQTTEHQQLSEWRLLMKEFASVLVHVASSELLKPRCVYEQLDDMFLASNIFVYDASTRQMIRQTVINPLLAKWDAGGATDADSGADGQLALRREYLSRYVRTMAQTVLSVEPAAWLLTYDAESQYRTQMQYRFELQDLTELIRYYGYFDTSAKALLASTLRDVIERVLYIYTETNGRGLHIPGPVNTPGIQPIPGARESDGENDDPLPSFCRIVIDVLQVQLGEPFLQQVIRVFLGQARADTYAMQQHRSLITLLGIFVLIVRQPGNRTLIADIVQLCVGDVLPVALGEAESQSGETHGRLCITLFELFHVILMHRWRYFVPPQVPDQSLAASVSNESQYAAILQAYGLVITNSADSELVYNVIVSLRMVNERYKLFREPYFAEHFAARFTHAFLHVLVEAKGDLYHQPLVDLLYELSIIDRRKFYDLTVTVCPALQPELRHELCQCTDMPTFARLAKQFVDIARTTAITLRPQTSTAGATSSSSSSSRSSNNNNNNNSNNNNNNNNNNSNNNNNNNNNNNSGVGGVQF